MIKSVFNGVAKTARIKVVSFGTAFVLAATSLSGAAPLFTQTAFAAGPTVSVCASGCDYTTIQDGIDNVDAGGTVNVGAGTYSPNINVNKPVTLTGAPGATVSVPSVTETNGFNVHANGVTIQGFAIEGPASSSYLTYAWGSVVTRGIFVYNGVTNFNITGNKIQNLRNNILVDGRNTGSITNNVIDNSKSGISVQYTDAGTGNTEGYVVNISGNTQGVYGNEWGLNSHLNGHFDIGLGALVGNAVKIAPVAPVAVQQALLANKASNGGWAVQDQGYSLSNRTEVAVAQTGSDANQGSQLGPLATIQAGINAVVANGGVVNVKNGVYNGGINVDKSGVSLKGQSQAGVLVNAISATPYGQGISVVGVNNVSISDMTFGVVVGAPVSYHFQAYKATNLNLTNLTFNGPGKATTPRIGGVDVNSSQGLTYNNVSASNYSKNGFSFTAQFTAADDFSRNISLNNITSNNNNWAGVAFYTMNSSSTVGHDITGVSFNGANVISNNTKGIEIVGDSDANVAAGATPRWNITSPANGQVSLGATAFSGNLLDAINYQVNGVQAIASTFNGLTGDQMTGAQQTAQDSLIFDQLDKSALGLVQYKTPPVTPAPTPETPAAETTPASSQNQGNTTTTSSSNAGGLGGGLANFGANAGQVLGVNTDTSKGNGNKQGKVKSASTKKSNVSKSDSGKDESAFLGLGWWWLAVLAALVAGLAYWLIAKRRSNED